jgi:uncharacterized protein with PIN domain
MSLFKRRRKFLLDENLGDDAADWLRSQGFNVNTVRELGRAGASDQEIYQLAKRHDRTLMTRDAKDFWNDKSFPLQGSPGLIVVEGDYYESVVYAERYFGGMAEVWKETKVVVSGDGAMRIKQRERGTGAVTTRRYRFHGRELEQWEDDK